MSRAAQPGRRATEADRMANLLNGRPVVPRGLVVLVGLAATVIVLAGLRAAAGLVGPIFLALVLTIVVHPVRGRMTRMGLPGWAATLICLVVVYALVLGLTLALVIATARFATLIPQYEEKFDDLVGDVVARLASAGVGDGEIRSLVDAIDFGRLAGFFASLLGGVVEILSSLVFVLTLLLFLTVDAGTFPKLLASADPSRAPLVSGLRSFAIGTRTYLVVSTVFGLIVAVIDTVVLALLDIPVPLLWGLLAFITNYIPNVGFVIGLVPPAVLGLLEGGWTTGLAVIVLYSLINVVIQSIIQPKFVGDAVGLSTTLTFLSLVVWSWVLGPVGALLAIPFSLLVRSLLVDVDPRSQWLTPLLSNRPQPVEPTAVPAGTQEN
ncbi:AI-2E family transporter [Kribbella sp. CA-247076]|uniref:AI-2E family transporter n=1 Tax=Kribbella sp. CA-247076 TaxID=3239941 RepID=UPI003D920685